MNRSELTVTEVRSKAKSKNEKYRLLTTENGLYLPSAKDLIFNSCAILSHLAKKVGSRGGSDAIASQRQRFQAQVSFIFQGLDNG